MSSSTDESPPKPAPTGPLTKTKLFTQGDEGSWTEIGVGEARIVFEDATGTAIEYDTPEAGIEAAVASQVAPRLVIESLEEDEHREMLLSTPLSADNIYNVQKHTIMIWTDPELARDMAASFQSAEGCSVIMDQIGLYRAARQRLNAAGGGGGNGNGGEDLGHLSVMSGNSDPYANVSPWSVSRDNLPALRMAVINNKQRLSLAIRDSDEFGAKLLGLFATLRSAGDAQNAGVAADIVAALLSPPFALDNKILGQIVDKDTIETTVDAVQFHLGRRDAASGFVSAAERRALFRNPLDMPADLAERAHFIAEVQRLKDLMPLQLDDSDAGNLSVLSLYCIRLRYELLSELLGTSSPLYKVLERLDASAELNEALLQRLAQLVPLLHDASGSLRNCPIPFEPKDALYSHAVDHNVLSFVARVYAILVKVPEPPAAATASSSPEGTSSTTAAPLERPRPRFAVLSRFPDDAEEPTAEVIATRTQTACSILGRLADCVCHWVTFCPKARHKLLELCLATPMHKSLLALFFGAVAVVEDPVAQQSIFDCVHYIAFRPPMTPMDAFNAVDQCIDASVVYWWTGRLQGSQSYAEVPVPAGLLIDVVNELRSADAASDPSSSAARATRVRNALRCITIALPRLPLSARAIGPTIRALLTAVCYPIAAAAVEQSLRVGCLQVLGTIFAQQHPELWEVVAQETELVAETVVAALRHSCRRRQGLMFGSTAAMNKALLDTCEEERWPAPRKAAKAVADTLIAKHGAELQRLNPAFRIALEHYVSPSARTAASGSAAAPAAAQGGSPEVAANPYLSQHNRKSLSQHRGDSLDATLASVDDEFHALMAEFDAVAVPQSSNSLAFANAAGSEADGGLFQPFEGGFEGPTPPVSLTSLPASVTSSSDENSGEVEGAALKRTRSEHGGGTS